MQNTFNERIIMLKFIKDKITFIVPILVCGGILYLAYGCQPTTKSLLTPNRNVSAGELSIELETLVGMYNLRIEDLEKKAQFQQWFFEQAAEIVETGHVNPIGVLMSLLSVLGVGAGADNLRVRKKLKNVRIETITENESS